MRLRTQLILAFFLLAVLPLAVATLVSYNSSLQALQTAVQAESDELAHEMEDRMRTVTSDLRRRIDRLTGLPLWAVRESGDDAALSELQSLVLAEMGDSARYLEQLEFLPPPKDGAPAAPESADPGEVQISLSLDLDEVAAGTTPALEGLVLFRDEGGNLVVQGAEPGKRPPSPEPSPAPPLKVEPPAGEETALPEGMEWARGLASLAQEIEQRHRLRQAGAEVPEIGVEELSQRLARKLNLPADWSGERVGAVRAQVSSRVVLRQVMSRTRRDRGEIPFAVDADGALYTPDPADRPALERLGLDRMRSGAAADGGIVDDWVTVVREDPSSGLLFGIARPVGGALGELRATAARNLGLGLGMVGMALLGILPLSGRMTRNLQHLTKGAETLARGDLDARVPVRSRDEFGSLASAFNRMAGELKENQERLVQQERLRREVEIGREIQQELLPRETLHLPFGDVRGVSIPAREVGGDFYNYFGLPGGEVALLVGDVSGKGVPAALLMANLQAMLRATLASGSELAALVDRVDRDLDGSTPAAVYSTLFVGILDPSGRVLRYVNAGHNPPFAILAAGELKRLDTTGRPVGLLAGGGYREASVALPPGGVLFLYTDGLTESESPGGEEFGMQRLEEVLRRESAASIDGLLQRVEEAVRAHRGPCEAADDATMMALRLVGG